MMQTATAELLTTLTESYGGKALQNRRGRGNPARVPLQ
jgi:hypothetical protein